jgi:hypothetical protein
MNAENAVLQRHLEKSWGYNSAGECHTGSVEVEGSNPFSSTNMLEINKSEMKLLFALKW